MSVDDFYAIKPYRLLDVGERARKTKHFRFDEDVMSENGFVKTFEHMGTKLFKKHLEVFGLNIVIMIDEKVSNQVYFTINGVPYSYNFITTGEVNIYIRETIKSIINE